MTLEELSSRLRVALEHAASRARLASGVIKILFVAVGSAVVAVAQFAEVEPNQSLTVWQIIGISFSIVVAVGAVFVAFTEDNATQNLLLAQSAIEKARTIEALFDDFEKYENTLFQVVSCLASAMFMRRSLESSILKSSRNIENTIEGLLRSSERDLPLAFGFESSDIWTICVYRAVETAGGTVDLVCKAHNRALKCEISEARVWSEGVGVVGISFSNAREIMIPDLISDGLGSMFKSGQQSRSYDAERYRSIVAVPIEVEGVVRPWGVVVATSNQPGHFDPSFDDGFQNAEPARVLSGLVALAVAISDQRDHPATSGDSG